MFEKRLHRIAAHIRRNRDRVRSHLLEEGPSIHVRSISDISTLGIRYHKMIGVIYLDILDRLRKTFKALQSMRLIERAVRLVAHAINMRGIDNCFVEGKDRVDRKSTRLNSSH